jgi:hypothetical protein
MSEYWKSSRGLRESTYVGEVNGEVKVYFAICDEARWRTSTSKNPSNGCSNPCVLRETPRANPYGTARLRSSGGWLRMRSSPDSVMNRRMSIVAGRTRPFWARCS